MNRPYKVICHMAMSIDGRAAGHYLSAARVRAVREGL